MTEKKTKKWLICKILGGVSFAAGLACLLVALFGLKTETVAINYPELPSQKSTAENYSALTGEVLQDGEAVDDPTYCVQIPNGMDGARPQAGLTEAGVVFEAIAEAGITRFAAIFQNPSSAVIGPIRSLRIYYLEWDTPFDCTIVHAGGSGDALAAVASGGYKDLSENYTYMYRGTYRNRLWNNLFTTASYLKSASGGGKSTVKGFARMTPEESERARIDETVAEKLVITEPTEADTSTTTPEVSSVSLSLGGYASFNVKYDYDAATNTYRRSFESGAAHEVYQCPAEDLGEKNPEDACSLTQLAPAVVVAMVVQESRASDNYHEAITTIGSGEVYVFQNGIVKHGTWKKGSAGEQIQFLDENGSEIKLAPGQTFVTAVPGYGSVNY